MNGSLASNSVAIACLALFVGAWFGSRGSAGHDMRVYCAAAEAWEEGRNPYLQESLDYAVLSWAYQPIFLPAFTVGCRAPLSLVSTYPAWWALLALIPSLLFARYLGLSSVVALAVVTSFVGLLWNLTTSNVAILELVPLSLAAVWVRFSRYRQAAFVVGLAASLKVLPVVYLLLFLGVPVGRRRVLAAGAAGFLTPAFLSLSLSPSLSRDFVLQTLGLLGVQHAPIHEVPGHTNPTLLGLATQILDRVGVFLPPFPVFLAAAAVLVGPVAVLSVARVRCLGETDPRRFVATYALGFLLITLVLPRLKPYAYLAVVPIVALLLERASSGQRALLLTFSSGLPTLFLILGPALEPLPGGSFFVAYAQWLSLLAFAYVAARTYPISSAVP